MGAALETVAHHWPVYLIEAALLGAFMFSASAVVATVQHPASAVRRRVRSPMARRAVIGVAMGVTAVALIYSPWGQRSGAHFNPAVTLAFAALGRIAPWDAVFYIPAQMAGGIAGMLAARAALGERLAHASVDHVRTVPGARGPRAAFVAEAVISFALFSSVLAVSRSGAAAYTGLVAGALVALFITFEAPLSGMSMNPARTIASAVSARRFTAVWVYLVAPPCAMLAAAGAHAVVFAPSTTPATMSPHAAHKCLLNCRHDASAGNHAAGGGIQHNAGGTADHRKQAVEATGPHP